MKTYEESYEEYEQEQREIEKLYVKKKTFTFQEMLEICKNLNEK